MGGFSKIISLAVAIVFLCQNTVFGLAPRSQVKDVVDASREAGETGKGAMIFQTGTKTSEKDTIHGVINSFLQMFSSYDKENILSERGKEVLMLINNGRVSIDELGFDIEKLRGLSPLKVIEQLILPEKYGGLNNGRNSLFITPEEYLKRNPGFIYYKIKEEWRIVAATGCDNDCMFCSEEGRRPVKSLPYPIIVQAIIEEYRGFEGRIEILFYYNDDKTDSFYYRDRICGANIADIVKFNRRFPFPQIDGLVRRTALHTAGYSPFDPKVTYVKDAIKQLRAQNIPDSIDCVVTFHLFRPEIEEAILRKDKKRLSEVVKAYIQMYKELLLCRRNVKSSNRNNVPYEALPEVIIKIGEIQEEALDELKRDKEIQDAKVVFCSEGILWNISGRSRNTLMRLRKTEETDPDLTVFLRRLDIEENRIGRLPVIWTGGHNKKGLRMACVQLERNENFIDATGRIISLADKLNKALGDEAPDLVIFPEDLDNILDDDHHAAGRNRYLGPFVRNSGIAVGYCLGLRDRAKPKTFYLLQQDKLNVGGFQMKKFEKCFYDAGRQESRLIRIGNYNVCLLICAEAAEVTAGENPAAASLATEIETAKPDLIIVSGNVAGGNAHYWSERLYNRFNIPVVFTNLNSADGGGSVFISSAGHKTSLSNEEAIMIVDVGKNNAGEAGKKDLDQMRGNEDEVLRGL